MSVGNWYEDRPLHTNKVAPPAVLTEHPEGTPYVPANMTPDLRDTSNSRSHWCHAPRSSVEPEECFKGKNADAPLVALWGDSHANTWSLPLESLADDGKIQLLKFTKTSCGIADMPAFFTNGDPYPQCDLYRQAVIDRLMEVEPDVVIVAGYSNLDFFGAREGYEAALVRSLSAVQTVSPVIMMEDVPESTMDPLTCLSGHLDDANACARTADLTLQTAGVQAERAAAKTSGATLFETEKYLCGNLCPLIQGDTLVYVDQHHLSGPFTELFKGRLLEAITVSVDESN